MDYFFQEQRWTDTFLSLHVKKFKRIILFLLIAFSAAGAKAQSDVKFNDGVRYSQWVIDSRLGDFYGNTNDFGFTTYNRDLTVKKNVTKWKNGSTNPYIDYVPGLVAKATIEAAEYYKKFDWAKPWFKSVEWYGNKCTVPTEPDNLDAINASKMYFGIYALANGSFSSNAESTTASKATTQLGNALSALKHYNETYAFTTGTTLNSKDIAGGWYHKSTYQKQMWLDGQYMGPALLAQLINDYSLYSSNKLTDNDWDLIAKQFTIVWNQCWDDTEKLLYHAFSSEALEYWTSDAEIWTTAQTDKTKWKKMDAAGHSSAFWGRAEGWYFLALVDVLEQMPTTNANYNTLKNYLTTLADGIKARQDATSGCWYQLVGKDGSYTASYYNGNSANPKTNYLESSCTAIFTAAYLKAIRLGLLDKTTYEETATKAYKGMIAQFMKQRTDGTVDLLGCCKSAGLGTSAVFGNDKFRDGSNAYYLLGKDVPPTSSSNSSDYYTEGKVLGAFIMAATEYEREYQHSTLLSKDLNKTYNLSSNQSLTVEVLGDGTPEYQWYYVTESTESPITGANGASYTPTQSGKYYCKITVIPPSAAAKTRATSTSGSYTITTSTAEVTVAAATTYTVTFNAGSNGTCSQSPMQVSAGANITLPSVSAKTGYTFDGWYDAETGGKKIGDAGKTYTPDSNITLYAHYSATGGSGTEQTITINVNNKDNTDFTLSGGNWSGSGSSAYYGLSSAGKFTIASKIAGVSITKIELKYTENKDDRNGETITVSTGTYSYSSDNVMGTWTGNASSVSFTTTNKARISYIKVYYSSGPSISFTTQPTAVNCVQDASASLSVAAAVNNDTNSEYGGVTYQWYSNKTESNQNGTPLEGKTEATLTPSTSNPGTDYYYCVATATKTADPTKKLTATSNVVALTVSAPTITITTQPADDTFAVGTTEGSISVVASANNEKECKYQWYKCDDTSKTNASAIPDATNASYSPDKATAGTYYYYCVVKADGCADVTSDVATVTVKKLAIVLEYLHNGSSSLTWNSQTQETKPADFTPVLKGYVANEDGTKSSKMVDLSKLKIEFKSDVTDVATVTNDGTITIVDNANGGAKIYAIFDGKNSDGTDNNSYEKAQTFFNVIVTQGYSYKVANDFNSSTRPALNSSVYIKNGETNLVKMTFGGWKWNVTSDGKQSTYSVNGSDKTDIWSCLDSQKESEIASIDGYYQYIAGATDAVDESKKASEDVIYGSTRYGWFKPAKTRDDGYLETYPYSLPVRGAYMTFEPTQNGTLTVYILQNGAWNTNRSGEYQGINFNDGEIVAGEFRPHSFYICNQRGLNVDQFSPNTFTCTTKQKVQGDYYCDLTNSQSDPKNIATWKEFKDYMSDDERSAVAANWKSGINGAQKIVQLDNGSYLAIQKGIVKYSFFVTANETYYLFSNFSKLGFCGANFVPSKTVIPDNDDAHKITLSDETAYPTPKKVTDDTDPDKIKYAWKFGDAIKGYVPGFTIPLFKSIKLTRTFKKDQWTTLSLPFNLTQTEVEQIFGKGTQIIVFDKAETTPARTNLTFFYHEIQNVLPGYPYLIRPTLVDADGKQMVTKSESADYAPTYTNTKDGDKLTLTEFTVYNKAINPAIKPHEFKSGGYTAKCTPSYCTANENGNYSKRYEEGDIFVSESNGTVYISEGKSYGKGYRSYIDKDKTGTTTTTAKALSISFSGVEDGDDNGTTTEIRVTELADDVIQTLGIGGVYNLNGQKVADTTRNLPAGIYIVNGRKVVVK